ncbi:molybdate transport system ATP-binding protein [Methylobacterium sp. BE186]|uniref:molybdenum ABC transporter ATP-binding protein n=1 Tax=Methylobacterium sp. BE186 TaxID=2817715 RepID=UPI0028647C18|nr:molybdenum ABC transporter ATP-binding protein [Methylobacterium sp. BE186]MDR7038653.1 molybdate transport system ATP-binding protein [Methylobacterium sp. BE186]
MTLAVDVALRRGTFSLAAAFTSGPGLTALFGRSGSGKSTLIHLIAGLARPDRGRIVVGGETLLDTDRRLSVPVHRRRIACVFQEARLLPHLSVRGNLGYGRFFAGRRAGLGADLASVIEMLGIGHLLDRRPAGLSGGETQRVAIGRALLAKPRLLLMDEPLAALDEARKAEILPYIERLRDEAGIPIVYVSHAVAEVARLANTVVVLEGGRVAATGPADTILRRAELLPAHEAEAGALLDMVVEAHDLAGGVTRLSGAAGQLAVPHFGRPVGTPVRVRLPARDVLVATQRPVGLSARNMLAGRIAALTPMGDAVMVEIACGTTAIAARLTRASAQDLGLVPGLAVYAIVKSVALDPAGVGIGRRTLEI